MLKRTSMIVVGFYVMLRCWKNLGAEAFIGINYGRISSQKLIPSMVVDLVLQNGIQEVRLFSQQERVLQAFSGSGIGLMFGISNTRLQNFINASVARTWLEEKIIKYEKLNVRYVTIGTEPFSAAFKNKTYDNALDVLKLIQTTINDAGYGNKIKATIPHFTDILNLNNISKPSDADFREDIKEKMVDSIHFLKKNNAPFMVGMFPIYYVHTNGIDAEFAFIDNKSKYVVKDDVSGHVYTNVFDFLYDSYYWAMSKAGGKDLKILISFVGWPTDGYPGASIANAQRFYKSFLPHVTSNKGTPMRPGAPIDVYLHSLSDENRQLIELGGFQRHWGIYKFNGEPKYKIDFSGQGRDIFPTAAKGVTRMPKRWCVFNGNNSNQSKVNFEYNLACNISDCTSLDEGGSCSNLDYNQRISYAFNKHFQTEAQTSLIKKACHMQGLGEVVTDDPSNGTCTFPIEILGDENAGKGLSFGNTILRSISYGERVRVRISALIPMLLTLAVLIFFI